MESLAVPFKAIKEGLDSIGKFFQDLLINIGSMLQWLNPLSEEFFLKGLFEFLGNALSYINPFDENFILKDVFTFLGEIISYINPFSENFFVYKLIELLGELLKWLFVPETNPFDNLSVKFNEKFAFVNQIKDLFNSLLGFNNYGENIPTFNMTWKGVTFAFIDFSMFLNYRLWLHGIVLAIAWSIFIFKTYKKLPSIIGGFSQ